MTIDDKIRGEKLQYNIYWEATKMSELSSDELINMNTIEKILPSNQIQIIEQTKVTCFFLRKNLEKQAKK